MKKIVVLIIFIITILFTNVNAKDAVLPTTKYNEDSYKYIINGYNKTNKKDGHVIVGSYEKTENNKKYNEIIIVKYNKDKKIEWGYVNETDGTDNSISAVNYLYNDNKVEGYLITTKELDKNYLIELDLDGKLIDKIEQSDNNDIYDVKEIITNNTFKGYLVLGQTTIDNKKVGLISKYNKNIELEWTKNLNNEEYSELSVTDAVVLTDNENILGYNIILNIKKEDSTIHRLIRLNDTGEELKIIKEDFEEKDNPKIEKTLNGYVIYGYTYEVKLNENKSQSYYLLKYNNEDEVEWETIGVITANTNRPIKLQTTTEDNIEKYLVMTTNDLDQTLEITKISNEGIIESKVKKINNSYYDIQSFLFDNNNIHFIGQLKCPEDDNCAYKKKALYLISDEDKVIEVKDNDSKIILIAISIILVIGTITIPIVKRKKTKEA